MLPTHLQQSRPTQYMNRGRGGTALCTQTPPFRAFRTNGVARYAKKLFSPPQLPDHVRDNDKQIDKPLWHAKQETYPPQITSGRKWRAIRYRTVLFRCTLYRSAAGNTRNRNKNRSHSWLFGYPWANHRTRAPPSPRSPRSQSVFAGWPPSSSPGVRQASERAT